MNFYYSATWPKEIRELAHEFLSDPVRVTIGSEDLAASDSVKQIVEVIDMQEKDRRYVCWEFLVSFVHGTPDRA